MILLFSRLWTRFCCLDQKWKCGAFINLTRPFFYSVNILVLAYQNTKQVLTNDFFSDIILSHDTETAIRYRRSTMSNRQESAMWRFWSTIRSLVASDDYIAAAVLVNEVKTAIRDGGESETSDAVYSALLRVADQMGVRNPFRDQEQFFLIYKEASQFEKMDWEKAIAYMASFSRLPVLPPVLVNVLAERFEINPDTVLIAEAEKFVPCLQRMVDENLASNFVLTTQNLSFEMALRSVFVGYDNVEVIRTDIYRYEFLSRRFDLIFASPIFGGRTLAEDQNFMCREYDLVALENLALHLNDGGRLVITLPARVTFASGKVNDLRQFIQLERLVQIPLDKAQYNIFGKTHIITSAC